MNKKGEMIIAAAVIGSICLGLIFGTGTLSKNIEKIKAAHHRPVTVDK